MVAPKGEEETTRSPRQREAQRTTKHEGGPTLEGEGRPNQKEETQLLSSLETPEREIPPGLLEKTERMCPSWVCFSEVPAYAESLPLESPAAPPPKVSPPLQAPHRQHESPFESHVHHGLPLRCRAAYNHTLFFTRQYWTLANQARVPSPTLRAPPRSPPEASCGGSTP